jgi:hypothetical protein
MPTRSGQEITSRKVRMRGKLQNFAKAAILAAAQENCSIDPHAPAQGPALRILDGVMVSRRLILGQGLIRQL